MHVRSNSASSDGRWGSSILFLRTTRNVVLVNLSGQPLWLPRMVFRETQLNPFTAIKAVGGTNIEIIKLDGGLP